MTSLASPAVGGVASLDDGEFRRVLRSFLEAHPPGRRPRGAPARLAWQKEWFSQLDDAGWAAPSWPEHCGGLDLPLSKQLIYVQEMGRARAPGYPGTGYHIAGPTVVRYGTPDQHARWLAPLKRAEAVWAQGFSEPEAGSDLTALTTRAERDGDHYVVNGTKLWGSHAEEADLMFTLVRTGSTDSGDKGISYLVIDLHSPGVTVRPIRDLTGGADFCETNFVDVRVDVADRIGDEHGGWAVARTSLGHERAAQAPAQAVMYQRVVSELVALAHQLGVAEDPVIRQRLADAAIGARIMGYNASRTIGQILSAGEPGPNSSASRLFNSLFEQHLHEFAMDLGGAHSMLSRHSDEALEGGRWIWGFLRTRASTIGAGTSEIQRNTLGEKVLGLPR